MAKKTFQSSSKSSTAIVSGSGSNTHTIIMSVITIILIYCIYNYVRGLENCDCVNQQLVDRIKNIELFLLVVLSLGLITSVCYGKPRLVALLMANPTMVYILGLYLVFMLSIESYLVYNVYNLRKTLPKNCECADKWQLNLLYVQCVWYAIVIAMFILMLIIYLRLAYISGKML